MNDPTTLTARRRETAIDVELDALIPAPLSPLRKLVAAITLLGLALAVTYAAIDGLITPRPFANSSFGGNQALVFDAERNAIGAFVFVPNGSGRDVRITDVRFDAPGTELVDVTFAADLDVNVSNTTSLPATVASGDRRGGVWVWFTPTSCTDATDEWGFAEVTFDFGDGAFPPLSATHRIDTDPVFENRNNSSDGVSVRMPNNTFIEGTGPLALACEVIQ